MQQQFEERLSCLGAWKGWEMYVVCWWGIHVVMRQKVISKAKKPWKANTAIVSNGWREGDERMEKSLVLIQTVDCHSSSDGEPPAWGACTPRCCCFLQGVLPKNGLARISLYNKANKTLTSAQVNLSTSSYGSNFKKSQMLIHTSIIILFHLESFLLGYIQNYYKLVYRIYFISRQEKKAFWVNSSILF